MVPHHLAFLNKSQVKNIFKDVRYLVSQRPNYLLILPANIFAYAQCDFAFTTV